MATVGVGTIVRGSSVVDLAPNAAAELGDQFAAGGDVWLYLANAAVAPVVVTVVVPAVVAGQPVDDLAISVPASGFAVRGPFPGFPFGDASGLVSLTYAAHEDITFGAWKLGQ